MLHKTQFSLLTKRRFLPLFLTQFLGAFHDNLFKNAFVVLLLFSVSKADSQTAIITTLAAGVFILPFVLFSPLGGALANKYPKHILVRYLKIAELLIAVLGTIALFTVSAPLSYLTLFALGAQSALFSPAKYSILPEQLEKQELLGGNALLNSSTFIAILLGTIVGASVITLPQGVTIISGLLFFSAISGVIASWRIPAIPAIDSLTKISLNIFSSIFKILREVGSQPAPLRMVIGGIAWFYFLGGTYLAQIPNFAKITLNTTEAVLTLFLVTFSVFIALGGLLNNLLLRGRISLQYVPLAMAGITLFSLDLWYCASHYMLPATPADMTTFLALPYGWRILVDMALIALSGGLFVIPLNASLQHAVSGAPRAFIMAGSALLNALFIIVSSILCALMLGQNYGIPAIFMVFALINVIPAVFFHKMLKKTKII
ncbi:MAG: hypothetical protein GC136_00945 [Alphaproteobacteria bacterium]|nr:hypothetical protein [Alphaproteobacteria bacterium]